MQVTLCWATDVNAGTPAKREDCQGASMNFDNLESLPATLTADTEYKIQYTMKIPSNRMPLPNIPHANVHSCVRSVGFCTPFVSNTPGLSTHSAALKATMSSANDVTLESNVKLSAEQYTIIIHGRWFDAAGVKHDMARATFRDVQNFPLAEIISVSLGGVLLFIALVVGFLFIRTAIRRYRALVAKENAAFNRRVQRVERVVANAQSLAFPLCAISYSDFKSHGQLVTYETARAKGQLKFFDTAQEVDAAHSNYDLTFVSHQWKSPILAPEPDPTKCDFEAIVNAIEHLIKKGLMREERVLIWVDVSVQGLELWSSARRSLTVPHRSSPSCDSTPRSRSVRSRASGSRSTPCPCTLRSRASS